METADKDVAGVVGSFDYSIVKARKGNDHGLEEDIDIERFIKAFKDLMPILRLLGTAFYFVEQDIDQKLTAIKANQEKVKDDPHAKNVIDFIHWEKETNPKLRSDKHTTARHCLRLMRALHFINVRHGAFSPAIKRTSLVFIGSFIFLPFLHHSDLPLLLPSQIAFPCGA